MKLDYLQPKGMMTNDSYKHSISNIEEHAYTRNKDMHIEETSLTTYIMINYINLYIQIKTEYPFSYD
jgi:hypothetical protein